ncbi:hypothetical protein ABT297_03130 [Dactylosporangium sp. NPDC000555]|uniref:hypothetical protein n=1 Tax=Dactylosporangium sp. NPDC000555 TaxID=3154260 RepID=UPI00331E969C
MTDLQVSVHDVTLRPAASGPQATAPSAAPEYPPGPGAATGTYHAPPAPGQQAINFSFDANMPGGDVEAMLIMVATDSDKKISDLNPANNTTMFHIRMRQWQIRVSVTTDAQRPVDDVYGIRNSRSAASRTVLSPTTGSQVVRFTEPGPERTSPSASPRSNSNVGRDNDGDAHRSCCGAIAVGRYSASSRRSPRSTWLTRVAEIRPWR